MPRRGNNQTTAERFGVRLKRIRKERGLLQKEVARGLSQNYIAGVEKGDINPSPAKVRAMANGLNMPCEQLVGGSREVGKCLPLMA
jgi:transcriptional regulator with XRE-family HTH domain